MREPLPYRLLFMLLAGLLVWAYACVVTSCATREPVQLRDIEVFYVGDDMGYRYRDKEFKEQRFYLYKDSDGVVYRMESYRGPKTVIPIR